MKANKQQNIRLKLIGVMFASFFLMSFYVYTHAAYADDNSLLLETANKSSEQIGDVAIYSGMWGGCTWQLFSNGTVIVEASKLGRNPGLGEDTGGPQWQYGPWSKSSYELKDVSADVFTSIKRIEFSEGVKFPQKIIALFSGLKNLEEVDLSKVDATQTTNMTEMFHACESLKRVIISDSFQATPTTLNRMFCGCSALEEIDLTNLNTSNVTSVQGLFSGCSSLKSFSGLRTDNVENMAGLFSGCSSLTSIDLTGFNTQKATSMISLFKDCKALTSIKGLSQLDTSKVTDMSDMFYGCSSLTSIDLSSWNTGSLTNMKQIFYDCESLVSANIKGLNTSNVTSMQNLFTGCESLQSLDLSSWDTSNVVDMAGMFWMCSSLKEVNLKGIKTSKVEKMFATFALCSSLTFLDLSSFDTSKVTDMQQMFGGCSSLTSLDLSSFNTASVTDMAIMFISCSKLTSLNVSSFNTASVTNMREMFQNCSSLTSLDVSSFDTSSATDLYRMFYECTSLESLDLSSFNTSKAANMSTMLGMCSSLKVLKTGAEWTSRAAVGTNREYFHGAARDEQNIKHAFMDIIPDGAHTYYFLQSSSISLTPKTATYTGSTIDIDPAKVTGSKGKVTYTYYTDSQCKQQALQHINVGTYYVVATVAEDDTHDSATSKVVTLVITSSSDKPQDTPLQDSSISLTPKTATYTGSTIDIDPAKVTGSKGKVTYTYYTDSQCKQQALQHINAGTYYVIATVAKDDTHNSATSKVVRLVISKKAGLITIQAVKKIQQARAKKNTSISAKKVFKTKINTSGGKVTYKKLSGSPKKIVVTSGGKLTVKKGLKKGKVYTVRVKATSAATKNYKAAVSKTISFKVSVK